MRAEPAEPIEASSVASAPETSACPAAGARTRAGYASDVPSRAEVSVFCEEEGAGCRGAITLTTFRSWCSCRQQVRLARVSNLRPGFARIHRPHVPGKSPESHE